MDSNTPRHLMLFDGACAFCRRSIEFARALDTRKQFRFEPFQNAQDPRLTPAIRHACEDAVHVLTPRGQVLRAGRACFYLLEVASGNRIVKRLARLMRSFPLAIPVEIGYQIVAKNRGFFSKFF